MILVLKLRQAVYVLICNWASHDCSKMICVDIMDNKYNNIIYILQVFILCIYISSFYIVQIYFKFLYYLLFVLIITHSFISEELTLNWNMRNLLMISVLLIMTVQIFLANAKGNIFCALLLKIIKYIISE